MLPASTSVIDEKRKGKLPSYAIEEDVQLRPGQTHRIELLKALLRLTATLILAVCGGLVVYAEFGLPFPSRTTVRPSSSVLFGYPS
jgi:hypothetical protein